MNISNEDRSAEPDSDFLPPLIRGYPIVGAAPGLFVDPFRFSHDVVMRSGGAARMSLGLGEIFLFGRADHAQQILRTRAENFVKVGAMWDAAQRLLGPVLATTEGDGWRRRRRMMQPQFYRQRLAGLTEPMTMAEEEELERWRTASGPDSPSSFSASCSGSRCSYSCARCSARASRTPTWRT